MSIANRTPRDSELDRLRDALRTRSMSAELARAVGDAERASDVCRVLDVKYEPGTRCTILYELGMRPIVAALAWDDASERDASAGAAEPSLEIYAWPNDPGVFGLARFMEPDTTVGVVARALSSREDRVLRVRVTPMRYRPGRRCTLRVDVRVRRGGDGDIEPLTVYAKLYHDVAKASSVWDEMQTLYRSEALRAAHTAVAEPLAFVPELGLVVQRSLPGRPLDGLLAGDAGAALACRAAVAVAAVHDAGLSTARVRPIDAFLGRMAGWADVAGTLDRALGSRMGEVVTCLEGSRERLPAWGEELALVHGDCKPSQFLVRGRSLALLDFDHCGMADPASDAGNFLATLRQIAVRHDLKTRVARRAPLRATSLRRLEDEHLNAYAAARRGGAGLALRARWYEAVALTRKAYRSWQRSPWSPLPHALLQQARSCLEGLPVNDPIPRRHVGTG